MFREQYGDVEIGIETLKKEDRNQPGKVITLREFLQVPWMHCNMLEMFCGCM